MAQVTLTPPSVEPLTLAETKSHIRIDNSEEEPLVRALLTAARTVVEVDIRHALIRQSRRCIYERDQRQRRFQIPVRPLISVDAVRLIDKEGGSTELQPEHYSVNPVAPSLTLKGGTAQAAFVEIDVTAGFGADPADVPQPLKQAILMLATHWYENRAAALVGEEITRLPDIVRHFLAPYRRLALC